MWHQAHRRQKEKATPGVAAQTPSCAADAVEAAPGATRPTRDHSPTHGERPSEHGPARRAEALHRRFSGENIQPERLRRRLSPGRRKSNPQQGPCRTVIRQKPQEMTGVGQDVGRLGFSRTAARPPWETARRTLEKLPRLLREATIPLLGTNSKGPEHRCEEAPARPRPRQLGWGRPREGRPGLQGAVRPRDETVLGL